MNVMYNVGIIMYVLYTYHMYIIFYRIIYIYSKKETLCITY